MENHGEKRDLYLSAPGKCGIDSKTIRRLRANDNMETKTLNKLCAVLECSLEDIAEYVKD